MNTQTAFERLDVISGSSLRFTPDAVSIQDLNIWSGLKVECWEGEGQELAEAVLPEHHLIVNIGAPVSGEMRWSSHRGINRPLASRHVALVPAYLPYRAVSTSRSKSLVLALRPDYLNSIRQAWSVANVELRPVYDVDDGFILQTALALADDVRGGNPIGALYGESLQAALAAHLLSHYATKLVSTPRADLGERHQIREMILDQLHKDLKLADLAQELQTDVSTFVRWFRKAYGLPPHQFILRERIGRAKVLLRTTSESLTNIALHCGFSSHSHFSTQFKRIVGVQPAKYRLAARR